jgi:hypothetical protein
MNVPAPIQPIPSEGLAFDIRDLQIALMWVARRPDVRLLVATDHSSVQEALEIWPPGMKSPRWCIWRDDQGHIHVDDWVRSEFDLPYYTLLAALAFIDAHL